MNQILLKRISKVIQTEATTSSIGDFLLTHVPFENLYLDIENKKSISEGALLSNILLADHDGHKFVMIQGSNGSGKSHLIRWLKEKYINSVERNKEAVLLISRAHNTLQDALAQLLEADIFPDEIRDNEIKAIKGAKSNITGDELKRTIVFNFTLEIRADEKSQEAILDLRTRNWLDSYLGDPFILKEFLLTAGGPIERIRAKIENVNKDTVNIGDGPMFVQEDFAISHGQIGRGLNVSDGRAAELTIRLAEKFADRAKGEVARQKVADYLNTKVSNVIQRSMKLQTGDFKKLFASLRKVLKRQGMNLTLFVEDINSFAGIDEALMEVLLTDHHAEGNHDYCRLISVVGSTNAFYRDKLNASIKERINDNIYIQEKSVLGDRKRLAKFAAKYINAVNLSDETVSAWVDKGANDDELPVFECPHEWAAVDCGGQKLSIFPLNENALWKLYSTLSPEKKTPRVLLKSVIAHVLKLWGVAPEEFLSNEGNFSNADIVLPHWESSLHKDGNIAIASSSALQRGILLRLWGNGTTKRESGLLGGLPVEVFRVFNVYVDISGEPKPIVKADHIVVPSTIVETGAPAEPVAVQPSKPARLLEIENELEEWLDKNRPLANHILFRDCLYPFIASGVDWELEGVPMLLVTNYINLRSRVHIEGQTVSLGDGLVLERNRESQSLLIALANWRYAGNYTWHFEGGSDYLVTATAWLERHKAKLIEGVVAPKGLATKWNLPLWNVAALYCIKTLFGGVDISKSSEDLVVELLQETPIFTEHAVHSKAWQDLKAIVLKDVNYRDKLARDAFAYFSKSVGSAEAGETKYVFVDAVEIIRQLQELKARQWNLKGLCPAEAVEHKNAWWLSANFVNVFLASILKAIAAEKSEAENYLNFFANTLDNNFEEQSITDSFKAIREFLEFVTNYLNLSYNEDDFKIIKPSAAPKKLITALHSVSRLRDTQKETEALIKIAKDPFDEIEKFHKTFIALNKLLSEKEIVFGNSVDSASKEVVERHKKVIVQGLDNMLQKIESIRGDENGNR